LIHPGILGCAPSAELLATWNKREGELIAANKLDRIVAQPPEPNNVHAGSATEDIKEKVGKEGDYASLRFSAGVTDDCYKEHEPYLEDLSTASF
jgi:hypothetical protein